MRGRSWRLIGILLICILAGVFILIRASDSNIQEEDHGNVDVIEVLEKDLDRVSTRDEEIHSIDNADNEDKTDDEDDTCFSQERHETEEIYNQEGHLNMVNIDERLINYPAGTIVNTNYVEQEELDSLFFSEELSQEIIDRITGRSFKEEGDVPYSELRYIRVLHMSFDGHTHIGELIVNQAIAQDVVDIFHELYSISYPIERILLIDDYHADDTKSMEDNNSSAFNYRLVDGTTKRSVHSYGLAIDINPLYNPYVRTRNGELEILPESGAAYVDRSQENSYFIRKDDPCYKAFISRGFTWGGEWKNSKDYQHFEKKL